MHQDNIKERTPAILRLIPSFYFTAKYGDQGWMIMLTSLLGLTIGYLTVCVLTEAPKGSKGTRAKCLGKLACVLSFSWYILWGGPLLALAQRQGLVMLYRL
uniref:Uncharacterized protein n=1 Tax=Musa acuminata subsp. malaccensis TaxID=214687 RepID=A0A804KM56_MUSAM